MMPLGKDKNRCIYIAALVISLLLIVGSIYLHLRQKTHLGRMSFNLDRDLVKPTAGVEATTTWMTEEYDSKHQVLNETNEHFSSEEDIEQYNEIAEKLPAENNGYAADYTDLRPSASDADATEDSDENEGNSDDGVDNLSASIDEFIDDIEGDFKESSEYELTSLEQDSAGCLRCLCMTVNGCRPTFCGSGNPCGLYRISKSYWIDAGRPTIAGGTTGNEDQDYLTCVNEDTCSSTVIQQYYNRYKRDCNKDDKFDCRDQVALHFLGPSGCLTKDLSYLHANRLKNCLIESNLNYFSYSEEEYK